MGKQTRYTPEQIVVKLHEHEKLQAQEPDDPAGLQADRDLRPDFYRWRTRYGARKEDEAQRLRGLEQDNARLKRIVADQALDISMLEELAVGE